LTERLQIVRMGHRGDGVAEGEAGPIFVPQALPGETVEVQQVSGHPDRRRLLALEAPSPERIGPVCPHFGICGGCAVQHWAFDRYRAWKRDLVIEALAHAGLRPEVDALIDGHGSGRRRAVFHARFGGGGILAVGFAASRSHRIVPIDGCPVLAPELSGAVDVAWVVAEVLASKGKPLDIAVTGTGSGLDVDVRGSGPLTPETTSRLAGIAEARRLARLTRHGELVVQRVAPRMQIGRAMVTLPPAAFLQATAEGEAQLGRLVVRQAGAAKCVADLFAGIGPFALRLAEKSRVVAIDADAAAVCALASAAGATPGLKPVTVERRDLFRQPLIVSELGGFDAVLFDPPRQGAQAQSAELARSNVRAVIAVSCNPATLARDLRILCDGGYRIERVTPVDQFRYSAHVEVVARLARR
jgi:23S rRNA (uracil1939-C5)-methyltransferase